MRNITRDNLKYTGIVTLSQYIDGQKMLIKKIQNEGGKSLFDFFTDCLMGEFDLAKFKRPVKIKLLSLEGSEYFSKSSFIYLLSRPEKIIEKIIDESIKYSAIRYSFIIPRDFLGSDTSFTHIGLYANNATESELADFSAICEVGDIVNSVTGSSVLAVDWDLVISNNSKTIIRDKN